MNTWSKSDIADLVIVGAGIAGSAVALECAGRGISVVFLHREDERCGYETLSPATCKQLHEVVLGVGVPFSEVIAWWGSDTLSRQAYPGARIVDRLKLAHQMRAAAIKHASIFPISSPPHIVRSNGKWNVSWISSGGHLETIQAKFLCDATGRRSIVAYHLGAQRERTDDLCCVSVTVPGSFEAGTFTESVSDGWWNLCADGTVGTLAFYSTSGLLRFAKQDLNSKLQHTLHLKNLVSVSHRSKVQVSLCNSTRLTPCAGPDWIAVGDAAMTVQPLASAGIAKAIRDATRAIQVILGKNSEYDQQNEFAFNEYRSALLYQYCLESRWADSDFWKQNSHRVVK